MSDLNLSFKELSDAGLNVTFLKSDGVCVCYDPKSLINSEPDPYCEKCLGTGKKRTIVKSEKLRYQNLSNSSLRTDEGLFKTVEESLLLFAYEHYGIFDSEDMIFVSGANENVLYEIEDKKPFVYHDFKFLEFYCKKVKFSKRITQTIEKNCL
ncbi:MAG: hypothetical protein ACRC5T_03905 [Cetobacterium sp.]